MAIHLLLDFPKDKLVWDVGHQAYVHKMLTGRKNQFDSLRKLDGLSGFPKIKENPADTFDTGHSSTSLSVALGLAKARDLKGEDSKVFAVIGDGAMTGGLAFEALNNAAQLRSNMVIVLNDNKMSIARNVGGLSNYLGKLRTSRKYRNLKDNVEQALDKIPNVGQGMTNKIRKAKDSVKRLFVPGMLFEDMGLIYMGPVDGHNIDAMLTAFRTALDVEDQPVIVHVVTKKGKGYRPAELNPSAYHGVDKFTVSSGHLEEKDDLTYTKIFGQWMLAAAKSNRELVSVCAAMPDGTGLTDFSKNFPTRFFDVGIAEEHAVTYAAGLSAGGLRPVVSLYSTFMQRAYDQVLHDVCLTRQPVIFTLDRSGIVGRDGETHQGIYDISYLSTMPNMRILSPMDGEELVESLNFALTHPDGPIAVRYPRGKAFICPRKNKTKFQEGKAEVLTRGKDVLFLAVGNMAEMCLRAAQLLGKHGVSSTVVNMRFIKPWDKELVEEEAKKHRVVISMEDNVYNGGFSQQMEAFLKEKGIETPVSVLCWPDQFIEQGSPRELYIRYGLTPKAAAKKAYEELIK